eukprot:12281447-Ditylum_brightwellii.AAC.1
MPLGPLCGGISSSSVGIDPAVVKEKTLQMCSKGKRLGASVLRAVRMDSKLDGDANVRCYHVSSCDK